MDNMITIPFTVYNQLLEDSNFLGRLYAAGVDNWEGYHYACVDDEDEDDWDED